MQVKTKVILKYLWIGRRNRRARVLAKKAQKEIHAEKYPLIWKNDYVIKKALKYVKDFKINLIVKGFNNLPKKAAILTPNHQSAFDSMALMAAFKHPEKGPEVQNPIPLFIGKEELKKNKRVLGFMDLIETVYIPRKNPRQALLMLDGALAKAKKDGRKLIIFPEGTRTKDGELQTFKGGAFRVAKKGYLPIIPVTINHTVEAANLKRRTKIDVEVIFHKPLKPLSFMSSSNEAIGERVQKIVASAYHKPKIEANMDKVLAK